MAENKVTIATPTCFECNKPGTMVVDRASYNRWQDGALIQDAFPEMSVGDREQLKSGVHAACWDIMFGDLDEGDDDE